MHVDQESVFDNLKYSTQKTQYTHDTLMDTWKRDKSHSSEKFLNFQNTVLLLGLHQPVEIV